MLTALCADRRVDDCSYLTGEHFGPTVHLSFLWVHSNGEAPAHIMQLRP